jgi:hypothetical protein
MRAGGFGLHMRFFIEQLHRVMRPGCNVCIHIQQLLTYKVQHGYMGRRDFRGAVVDLFSAGGFDWKGEVAIPKNPQAMAQRLKLHSLMFATGYRDARQLAPAVNDYVMIFQKPGEAAPVPALARRGEYESDDADEEIGNEQPTPLKAGQASGWVTTEEWIKWASGVWSDIQETDVLDGYRSAREEDDERHVCLARGSLVLSRDGYMPIEDVNVGDLVLTHEGRWKAVTAKRCNGVHATVRTTAQGVADLRTTPDHHLYLRRAVGPGRWPSRAGGTTHARSAALKNEPQWVRADESLGGYVYLPLPPEEESPLTAAEWWIIGRWLGDGHREGHRRSGVRGGSRAAVISCATGERDGLLERLGPYAGQTREVRTGFQIRLLDRGRRLRSVIDRCGEGASNKRVPAEALALCAEKAGALLDGYLSADGHYVALYDRTTASSVSRALLLGMAMVAQRARGVVSSVYAGRSVGESVIEGRTVHTRRDWILVFRNTTGYRQSGWVDDGGAWKKVRSVEPDGETEVWDLQVADDASFVAEGCVVHNCPLQLEVIRRCVKLYSNPGETVLDPFNGIGSTSYIALEQGRNAIGFELKESYHKQARANIAKLRRKGESNTVSMFELAGVAG